MRNSDANNGSRGTLLLRPAALLDGLQKKCSFHGCISQIESNQLLPCLSHTLCLIVSQNRNLVGEDDQARMHAHLSFSCRMMAAAVVVPVKNVGSEE